MPELCRALLVGSSFSAAPIFFALKKRGLHVSVCGKFESDPCHQYADASFFIDYSKVQELSHVVESNKFDYLVPTCNDYAYMSCVSIAEKYNFPGYDTSETALTLHTKSRLRSAIKELRLPAPEYSILRKEACTLPSNLCFPLLVKPVDSFSGRGVNKVEHPTNLLQAVEDAFKSSRSGKEIILEQFIRGNLHSHSAFIQEGEIAFDFFVDEFCTVYPYQVNCSNHPSILNDDIRTGVREAINKMVCSYNLTDGLLHTQFISSGSDFWIIEMMRRCPGDLYGSLVELSLGIEYADLFILPYLNQKLPSISIKQSPRFFARHTISVAEPIVNFSFSGQLPVRNIEIVPLKISGERLDPAPFDKLAIFFAEFDNMEIMRETTPRLAEYIRIRKHG